MKKTSKKRQKRTRPDIPSVPLQPEEEPQPLTRENPLTNALVLSILFNYLSFKDIKNVRQVCKLWWERSLYRFRSKVATLIINVVATSSPTSEAEEQRNNATVRVKYMSFKRFLEVLPEIHEKDKSLIPDSVHFHKKPFQNIGIVGATFPPYTNEEDKTDSQEDFFNLYGSTVTSFHIHKCYFRKGRALDGIRWILRKCPNLRELRLWFCETIEDKEPNENQEASDGDDGESVTANALEYLDCVPGTEGYYPGDMLKNMPNLKKLHMYCNEEELIKTLALPTLTGNYIKLEGLKLSCCCRCCAGEEPECEENPIPLLNYLKTVSPPLEDLSYDYDIQKAREPGNKFYEFLKSCQNTLKRLHLSVMVPAIEEEFGSFTDLLDPDFQFPNLTEFHLQFCFTAYLYIHPIAISFDLRVFDRMPNLLVFRCVGCDPIDDLQDLDFEDFGKEDSCKKVVASNLKEVLINSYLTTEELQVLRRAMPNVQTLSTILTEKTVHSALENFPNLKSLTLLPRTHIWLGNAREKRRFQRAIGNIQFKAAKRYGTNAVTMLMNKFEYADWSKTFADGFVGSSI